MATKEGPIIFDMRFLREASQKLQGYLLHTCFEHYLTLTMNNVRKWVAQGVIGPDAQPTAETDYQLLFDLDAIDIEKLTYIIGFYMYILTSHKWSNYYLMRNNKKKWILYLRGYDYEGAVASESETKDQTAPKETKEDKESLEQTLLRTLRESSAGSGLAVGLSSMDTVHFNGILEDLLGEDHEVFKVVSPRELYWETIGPQRYFYGDYDGLISACNNRIHSIYLNALYWQADISDLVDRIDYFIVYVSSITESALWELELLKKKRRAHQVTVIFDESAISNKELHAGLHDYVRASFGDKVRWTKDGEGSPQLTIEELRTRLSEDFLVVSPDDFSSKIEDHKQRIREATSPADANSRLGPIEFRFYPAVEDDELDRIREFDSKVESFIQKSVISKTITNLPWFLNNIQLRIFTSLMLGRHDDTGRTLAVYSAVMDVTRRHLLADVESDGVLSTEEAKLADERLQDHFDFARYAGPTLLGFGKSHEFGSYFEQAKAEYDARYASAIDAVEQFYNEAEHLRATAQRP